MNKSRCKVKDAILIIFWKFFTAIRNEKIFLIKKFYPYYRYDIFYSTTVWRKIINFCKFLNVSFRNDCQRPILIFSGRKKPVKITFLLNVQRYGGEISFGNIIALKGLNIKLDHEVHTKSNYFFFFITVEGQWKFFDNKIFNKWRMNSNPWTRRLLNLEKLGKIIFQQLIMPIWIYLKGEISVDRLAVFQHKIENIFRTRSMFFTEFKNCVEYASDEFRLRYSDTFTHFSFLGQNLRSEKKKKKFMLKRSNTLWLWFYNYYW